VLLQHLDVKSQTPSIIRETIERTLYERIIAESKEASKGRQADQDAFLKRNNELMHDRLIEREKTMNDRLGDKDNMMNHQKEMTLMMLESNQVAMDKLLSLAQGCQSQRGSTAYDVERSRELSNEEKRTALQSRIKNAQVALGEIRAQTKKAIEENQGDDIVRMYQTQDNEVFKRMQEMGNEMMSLF
jgi:hypothetical protein